MTIRELWERAKEEMAGGLDSPEKEELVRLGFFAGFGECLRTLVRESERGGGKAASGQVERWARELSDYADGLTCESN